MIIFGTKGVKSTIKSGNFNCPQCEQNKPYRHQKVTKFFSLYFIPLIPLGSAGEYIECQTCKGTFIPGSLNSSNSSSKDQFIANYEKAIRHSMVLVMLADGVVDENEKNQVLKIINKYGKNDLSMTELESYIISVKRENQDVAKYLKNVAPSLNERGKETIIKCALSVAASDGNVDPSELELISKMGQTLEMSSYHVKGILSEFFENETQL